MSTALVVVSLILSLWLVEVGNYDTGAIATANMVMCGIMTTASLMGLAVSPVAAGLIGSAGLRIVFVADVVLLIVLGIFVWRGLRMPPPVAKDSGDAALAEP